jgi:putative membrane protein
MTKQPEQPSSAVEIPVHPHVAQKGENAGVDAAVEIPVELLHTSQPVDLSSLDDFSTDENLLVEDESELAVSTPHRWPWLGWGLGLTGILAVVQWCLFVYDRWLTSPVWGGLYLVASGLIGIGILAVLGREILGLRHLRRQQRWQTQTAELRDAATIGQARPFCILLAKQLGWQQSAGYQHWLDSCEPHHTDLEVLDLFSQWLLRPLDQRAMDVIVASSSKTALLVATSPFMLLDMLIVLWRNLRLIEQVTAIYGVQLGYWGRITLIRQVCRHVVFAGLSELAIDLGHDWLSSEITAKLSLRAAQGLGSGLLSARLGLQVMRSCRPVDWRPEERPRLTSLRRRLWLRLQKATGQLFSGKTER